MGLWLDALVTALFPPELEKQMKIENLFVTWQQRSAQSNMPISVSAAWAGDGLGLVTAHWEVQQRGALEHRAGCVLEMVLGSGAVLSA